MNTPLQQCVVDALTDMGISAGQAQHLQCVIEARFREYVNDMLQRTASAQELNQIEQGLLKQMKVMRAEVRGLKTSRDELKDARAGMRLDMATLKAEMLKSAIDQTWKLTSFVVVINAAMLGVLKFFAS